MMAFSIVKSFLKGILKRITSKIETSPQAVEYKLTESVKPIS